MIKPSDCTIIIPHLGETEEQERSLDLCLESLFKNSDTAFKGEFIIVKNGTHTCKHEKLANIRIQTQGQCGSVNAAVATTNTPWIFITNDDMIYSKLWWDKLTAIIAPNDSDMCWSPKLVEPKPGAPTFDVFMAGGAGGDFDKDKWSQYCEEYHASGDGDLRKGFNLPFLIKRELWDTIGGYDINYDPWGSNSDSDLEYKIKLAGVQSYQNGMAIVYHFSQTSGTFEPRNQEAWNRNFAYFEEKWGFPRTDDGIWEASFTIPNPPIRKFRPLWEGKYQRGQ